MPDAKPDQNNQQMQEAELIYKKQLLSFFAEQLPRLITSCVLFVGGIVILFMRIPGWSLIIGLPAVQIGLVFLIFNYDRATQKNIGLEGLEKNVCEECQEDFFVHSWEHKNKCKKCEGKAKTT